MEKLEGEPLILHHADKGQRTEVLDGAVQKGLFQRGNDLGFKHGGSLPFGYR
jgi:hypothetical protein